MRRSNEYICMRDGSKFYLEKPTLKSIRLNDIAHALAMLCRYTGHVPEFYSVAQHAVLVSLLSKYPLAALHSYSSKAFLGIINDSNNWYKHKVLTNTIARKFRFNLNIEINQDIEGWDRVVSIAEILSMMPCNLKNLKLDKDEMQRAKKIKIEAFTWEDSKKAFLERHKELS